jgi:hypothetical protein
MNVRYESGIMNMSTPALTEVRTLSANVPVS